MAAPRVVVVVVSLELAAGLAAAGAPKPNVPELATLLARAGQYVVDYEGVVRAIVAEEEYRQMYWDVAHQVHVRNLRSDVVFVRLPGAIRWSAFRDVYAVDGKPVRDRAARLERLFRDSPSTAVRQARAIVQEGARYNLGPVLRTVNVPPIPLLFLHPDNQTRFSFKRKGRCSTGDLEGVELRAVEHARPTLVRDEDQQDVPSKARFCVDPANGAVLRTDVEFDLDGSASERRSWARILVLYRRDARLGALLPTEMKETYQLSGPVREGAMGRSGGRERELRIETKARYADFRLLEVTTEESFRPAGAPQ